MAQCGKINADGTVSVRISWKSGTPDPVSEQLHVGVYGGDYRQIDIPGPLAPGGAIYYDFIDLLAGQTYAATVRTFWPDGTSSDSAQMQFTTPLPARAPASNLVCSSP